ncbi:MAG: hypothetical protein NT027_11090, partial [Proteobacteria bacterium]|nr:hypothetical protein [Pseudomonadota bacterium]
LNQSFNLNSDYCFYAAHAAYKMNDFTSAISIIESAPKNLAETDVDCASLLGESYAARALSLESDEDARKAVTQLTNATKLMRRYGLEVGPSLSLIKRMEDRVGGSTVPDYSGNQFREPRSWLVMLSPRRADELVQSRDSLVEELHRPMGVEAAPGDVVLFASRSAHLSKKMTGTKQEWRVLAMYRVTSRPYWHPTQRWQSALELIDRPEHPIPIDAQELKSDISIRGKRNALPKGHHARYEVYKLDESAMDIMIAAVKRRSDGIHHDVERRNIGQNAKKPG